MPHCRFPAVVPVRIQSTVCLVGGVAVLALLSACASRPQQISAQQESTQYLSHARRNYTPPGPASDPWGPYIAEASAKFDVPERWVREVMRQESGGNLFGRGGELITSGAGAMGLMQVMPGTYDELRARYAELGDDPFDPHNNILAGTSTARRDSWRRIIPARAGWTTTRAAAPPCRWKPGATWRASGRGSPAPSPTRARRASSTR